MKDVTKATAEASRPSLSAKAGVDFCLDQLYADKEKKTNQLVAAGLTYEELLGALLLARDAIEELDQLNKDSDE